jgi:hypothetical protein
MTVSNFHWLEVSLDYVKKYHLEPLGFFSAGVHDVPVRLFSTKVGWCYLWQNISLPLRESDLIWCISSVPIQ